MSRSQPELLFVAGPQTGERCTFATNPVLIGRGSDCDVQTSENSVSRKQMRFEYTVDGWVLENLSSSSPMSINGKKYRPRKRIILDTGDVIAVGRETMILYVAAGDDPEAALAVYRTGGAESEDESVPAEVDQAEPTAITTPGKTPSEVKDASRVDSAEEARQARNARIRKYVIGFGVYAVIMVVGLVFLITHLKGGKTGGLSLRKLTKPEIAEAIRAPIKAPKYPTEVASTLREARTFYKRAIDSPSDLYRAVKYYKLYLAFKGSPEFENSEDERQSLDAESRLINMVQTLYANAYIEEKRRNWKKSQDIYRQLIDMLPVNEEPYPERDHVVFQNVRKRFAYVYKMWEKEKKEKKR